MFARTRWLFAASFFLSGGCALIYQVVWSKHLQYVFGSTTEAVGTILAVFMAGLGAGAHFFGPRIDRASSPLRLYALFEIGIGLPFWFFVVGFGVCAGAALLILRGARTKRKPSPEPLAA